MKNLSAVIEYARQRCSRLRGVVFVVGLSVTLLALLSPLSGSLGVTEPVHAFSRQTRDAGGVTFREKGCEHCHGVDGIGTDRGPDLSTIGRRWRKDRIEKQIREGGGGMPPFGDALKPDEIKNLVDYLSGKRKATKPTTLPGVVKGPPEDSGS